MAIAITVTAIMVTAIMAVAIMEVTTVTTTTEITTTVTITTTVITATTTLTTKAFTMDHAMLLLSEKPPRQLEAEMVPLLTPLLAENLSKEMDPTAKPKVPALHLTKQVLGGQLHGKTSKHLA